MASKSNMFKDTKTLGIARSTTAGFVRGGLNKSLYSV